MKQGSSLEKPKKLTAEPVSRLKKLQELAVEPKSNWEEEARFRQKNRVELKVSQEIAINLLRTLRSKNISREEFSVQSGIPEDELTQIAQGKTLVSKLNPDSLLRIQDLLDVQLVSERPAKVPRKKNIEESPKTASKIRVEKKPLATKIEPVWNVPENIPVESAPSKKYEVYTQEEERAKLDQIEEEKMERFGTADDYQIDKILYRQYTHGEADLEIVAPNPDFPVDPYDAYTPRPVEKPTLLKMDYHPKKRVENTTTLNPSKQERGIRGFLNKVKHFWEGVKAEKQSLAEQLDWDEEEELEKQARDYYKGLKETEATYGQEDTDHREAA